MFFDKKELVFLTLFKSIESSYFTKDPITSNFLFLLSILAIEGIILNFPFFNQIKKFF